MSCREEQIPAVGDSILYEVGDIQALERANDRMTEAARRSGMPYFWWAATLWQLGRAHREGRFAHMEASTEEIYEGQGLLDDLGRLLKPYLHFYGYDPEGPGYGNALWVRDRSCVR